MKCLNCGNEFEGAFCPVCGQSAKVGKLTIATLSDGLMRALFSFDKGIWRTLGHLFSKPGTMISDYIHGKRASYMNPFSLLVILTTIFVIEAHLVSGVRERSGFSFGPASIEIEDHAVTDTTEASGGQYVLDENVLRDRLVKIKRVADKSNILHDIYDWTKGNKMFYTIITIPVLALATSTAFRKRKRKKAEDESAEAPVFNYAECLCAMAFYSCQLLCISIVTMPFNPVSAKMDGFTDVGGLVMVIILAWDFINMYRIRKRKAFFKALEVIVINYSIVVMVALVLISLIWTISGLI